MAAQVMDREVVFTAAQFRPGDRVLITCADADWLPQERVDIMAMLQQRFPGVVFTLLNGASGIAVLPAGAVIEKGTPGG